VKWGTEPLYRDFPILQTLSGHLGSKAGQPHLDIRAVTSFVVTAGLDPAAHKKRP
jgi:hypothetical protein